MVSLTATDFITTLKTQQSRQVMKVIVWIKCVSTCVYVMQIESTHIRPLHGVHKVRHPSTNVQLHTDNWDESQKSDILDHVGPLCKLYSLNLKCKFGKGSQETRQLDVGLVCICQGERGKYINS